MLMTRAKKLKNKRLKVTVYYSLSSNIRDEMQRNKSSDLHLNTIFYYYCLSMLAGKVESGGKANCN
jgi:hypothetical protein